MSNGCNLLAAGVATVGLFSLASYLFVPTAGPITGAALGGGTFVFGGTLIAGYKFVESRYNKDKPITLGKKALLNSLVGIVAFFAGLCLSYLVCNNINSLRPITFTGALATAGHVWWMAMVLNIVFEGVKACYRRISPSPA